MQIFGHLLLQILEAHSPGCGDYADLGNVWFLLLRQILLALQNGVDVKTLSGLLGHYSAGFTLDTYGHISTQMQQDAAQKVGGFLRMNM